MPGKNSENDNDRDLGMHCSITRRDFLNGIAVTAGASLLPPHLVAAMQEGAEPEKPSGYYPPALIGLRGSHVGSFEVAHSIRDGDFWQKAGTPAETGEQFDLVIVGGGISGLSSAYFFRKANPNARILILDNHDDFGGHAKRNEFTVGDRKLLGYGGPVSLESPTPYRGVAKGGSTDLGMDVPSFSKHINREIYSSRGLIPCVFFDKEAFGADVLTVNALPVGGTSNEGDDTPERQKIWDRFFAEAPLSEKAKQDLVRLRKGEDYYPGLSSDEKKARLATISYQKYLNDVARVDPQIAKLYYAAPQALF